MTKMQNSSVLPLPEYLKECVTAYVRVCSSVLDTAPDIVVCNSAEHFLEIKGGKIVRSLHLNNEIGDKVNCFYICEKEKLFIFYVVKTKKNKLFLIKRSDDSWEVIQVLEAIKDYHVNDFILLGYPQLKIFKVTGEESVLFSDFFDTQVDVDQSEVETNLNSMSKLLGEKLQIVCRHVDELSEEWDSMKRIVQLNRWKKNFNLIPVESVFFSLPVEECAEKITVLSTWIKVVAARLVLGINICYHGKKKICGLEFKMYGKCFNEYLYRLFPYVNSMSECQENPLFPHEKINSSIQPGQAITVVGAALICFPNNSFERELKISCYLTSGELQNYLVKKTFEININDFFEHSKYSLNELCSAEYLQVIKTVNLEIKFKIKIKNDEYSLEKILKHNLEFEEIKFGKDKLYYCKENYLRETLVAYQLVEVTNQVWKFNFYANDESQISFFRRMLYELLPEGTTILSEEDSVFLH